MKLRALLASTVVTGSLLLAACSESVPNADLDRVLDVTADTLYQFEQKGVTKDDKAVGEFATELQTNMRAANPKVHTGPVGVVANSDGSFSGYYDKNDNQQKDSGEKDLFKVEIDSEKQRLIASDTNGYVRDHSFSGTGLMAGLLIGHLLSRQRAAGVNPKSLSNKTAMSKSQYSSARSKSSSGSHTRGK
ncbi:hypothetical protein [Aliikangiella sp. IMCC44359]|uniref:hypothetical protein n=1 Tax=Aliikangiella sp. IMCC44359 TaxID=3459125 RepID=UPI00403B014A